MLKKLKRRDNRVNKLNKRSQRYHVWKVAFAYAEYYKGAVF